MHHRGCTELLRAEESEESESEERQERKDNDGKDPHTDGKESEAVEGKESFHPYVRRPSEIASYRPLVVVLLCQARQVPNTP